MPTPHVKNKPHFANGDKGFAGTVPVRLEVGRGMDVACSAA